MIDPKRTYRQLDLGTLRDAQISALAETRLVSSVSMHDIQNYKQFFLTERAKRFPILIGSTEWPRMGAILFPGKNTCDPSMRRAPSWLHLCYCVLKHVLRNEEPLERYGSSVPLEALITRDGECGLEVHFVRRHDPSEVHETPSPCSRTSRSSARKRRNPLSSFGLGDDGCLHFLHHTDDLNPEKVVGVAHVYCDRATFAIKKDENDSSFPATNGRSKVHQRSPFFSHNCFVCQGKTIEFCFS